MQWTVLDVRFFDLPVLFLLPQKWISPYSQVRSNFPFAGSYLGTVPPLRRSLPSPIDHLSSRGERFSVSPRWKLLSFNLKFFFLGY